MQDSPSHYFCLDIGGTGTRGALYDEHGHELGRAAGPAGALSLGAQQCFNAIDSVWKNICVAYAGSPPPNTKVKLTAGIAGVGLEDQARELQKLLMGFGNVQLTSDGYGALIAATKGKPGALISIGTGIGALKLMPDGKTRAFSSWGFPAGDAGSGAWIGLRIFGDFLKALDGIKLSPALSSPIIEEILLKTGKTSQQIMRWQANAKPRDFAALTPLVVNSATKNDSYCVQLLREATGKISRVGRALIEETNPKVYLTGGLGGVFLPYCVHEAPEIDWTLSEADPLEGIFLLATGQVPDQNLLPRIGLQ